MWISELGEALTMKKQHSTGLSMSMLHLFEGDVYFVGGQCRGRHLFEGSIYSRVEFNGVIRYSVRMY